MYLGNNICFRVIRVQAALVNHIFRVSFFIYITLWFLGMGGKGEVEGQLSALHAADGPIFSSCLAPAICLRPEMVDLFGVRQPLAASPPVVRACQFFGYFG